MFFAHVIVTSTDFIWTNHTIPIAVRNSSRFDKLLFQWLTIHLDYLRAEKLIVPKKS